MPTITPAGPAIERMGIIQLKQTRARNVADSKAIVKAAEVANRGLTAPEQRTFDDHMDTIERIDVQLEQIAAVKRSGQRAAVNGGGLGNITVGAESAYRNPEDRNYSGPTFFRDMLEVHQRGADMQNALERLTSNQREWTEKVEQRTGIATDSSHHGSDFAPPVWAAPSYDYVAALRAGRPFLDWLGSNPLPLGLGPSLLLPVVSSGATVTEMASEGAAVSNTDPTTATDTVAIGTISGRSVASQQQLALGPLGDGWILNDLQGAYDSKMEDAAINSTSTNRLGLGQTASPSTLTSTGLNLFAIALRSARQIAKNALTLQSDFILTTPDYWLSFVSALESDGRPSIATGEGEAMNARATFTGQSYGHVGSIFKIPVIVSGAVNADLVGDSSYQSGIFAASKRAFSFMESAPRIRVADQVSISTLQVQFVQYGFFAQVAAYPKGICVVTGTGNIPATGFHN